MQGITFKAALGKLKHRFYNKIFFHIKAYVKFFLLIISHFFPVERLFFFENKLFKQFFDII